MQIARLALRVHWLQIGRIREQCIVKEHGGPDRFGCGATGVVIQRDDLVKVCGVDLAALAAGLDEEFVDHHPLDALTEKANRALGDAPVASISAKRRTGQHEGDSTSLQFEQSRSNSL